MSARCSSCDFEVDTGHFGEDMKQIRAHRREVHPGQASTAGKTSTERARNKRLAAKAAASGEDQGVLDGLSPPAVETPPAEPPEPEESAPAPARRGLRERLWGHADRAAPQGRERKPRARRADTADLLGMAWAGLGWLLVRTEADVPVGRCLMFQKDVAGDILQRVTKDTFVDKMLQPFAARVDELEALGSLVGIPVMVGMIERSPELQAPLEPLLRAALQAHFVAMLPVIEKAKKQEAKFAKVTAQLGLEGDDPIGAILDSMFAPPATAPQSQPTEAAPAA